MRFIGFLFAMAVVSGACAGDAIDEIVAAEMERQHIPGLGIAIVRDGKILKVAGYGLANVEHGVGVRPETKFQSASLGKQFTAALALMLDADGKLSIDAPVAHYLTNAPASWNNITIRQLLSHTAGLANFDPAIDWRKDYSEDELLASAYRVPLLSPAGQAWSYSNLGYQVLGILCSKVGGKFWGDQLRDRVFAPLGMSAQVISERVIVPHRAAGYDRVKGVLFNQEWVSPTMNSTADGSLYLSAADLAIWSRALDTDFPLTASMKASSWTPATVADGTPTEYGLGWHIGGIAGHRMVDHTGAWQGFSSYIVHFIDDRLSVAVLANRSRGGVHIVAEKIAAHLIPELAAPIPPPLSSKTFREVPVYLRGSFNGWGTQHRFRRRSAGIFVATVPLSSGRWQFKLASEDWNKVLFGAPFDEYDVDVGSPKPLDRWGLDMFFETVSPGDFDFLMDVRDPQAVTLTVRQVESVAGMRQ